MLAASRCAVRSIVPLTQCCGQRTAISIQGCAALLQGYVAMMVQRDNHRVWHRNVIMASPAGKRSFRRSGNGISLPAKSPRVSSTTPSE
jgi:hypothetical protein